MAVATSSGRGVVPSKWPQKPLASTASWKRGENMAQFRPEASSLGTEDGRVSANAVAVDIVYDETSYGEVFAE